MLKDSHLPLCKSISDVFLFFVLIRVVNVLSFYSHMLSRCANLRQVSNDINPHWFDVKSIFGMEH